MTRASDDVPAPPRTHVHTVRVFYGDTDQMGVAYYANYFRWFEMARNEYFRAAGCTYLTLESEGVLLPVIEASCTYRSPARYDDLLAITAWIRERTRVRLRFEYQIHRGAEPVPLATGHTVHACLDLEGVPRRFPAALLKRLSD